VGYLINNKKGEKMTNIKTQINEITSKAELDDLISFIRLRTESLVLSEIAVGTKVYVVQKTKKTLGTVTKINRSKAVVELPQGSYRVPLSMLEVA
tara:strand:+ start:501 stop:785 length:285 start_codon:yes stop_codon:yes gene_type:complete